MTALTANNVVLVPVAPASACGSSANIGYLKYTPRDLNPF